MIYSAKNSLRGLKVWAGGRYRGPMIPSGCKCNRRPSGLTRRITQIEIPCGRPSFAKTMKALIRSPFQLCKVRHRSVGPCCFRAWCSQPSKRKMGRTRCSDLMCFVQQNPYSHNTMNISMVDQIFPQNDYVLIMYIVTNKRQKFYRFLLGGRMEELSASIRNARNIDKMKLCANLVDLRRWWLNGNQWKRES